MKNPFKNIFKRATDWIDPIYGTLRYSSPGTYTAAKATKLSTVYRCVNLLSDSIASLPLNPYTFKGDWKSIDYTDGKFNILNVQPNPYMSAFMFKKLIIVNLLLRGNAYVLIERNTTTGRILGLHLLNSDFVNVQIVDGDIRYAYTLAGQDSKGYDKSQIIHLMNYTMDGIIGISTLQYAADSLGIAYSSEEHAGNFWKSGANLSGILKPVAGATINPKQAAAAKTAFLTQTNSDLGGSSGSVVVLGDGLEYQPITVNPKDSQLIESRAFNVQEICRFFGVPPTLAFSETGKFSTAEQQSLDYLNNSLTPLIEKVESEFFRKIYLPSEWDTSELKFDAENIMRLEAATRADYYSKMFQVGGYTSNEIREKINAQFPVKGGNRAFIQVNLQPTDALISEQTAINSDAKVDNQVKTDTVDATGKKATQTEDVQKTALNGAQVTSLVDVCDSVSTGVLTHESAKAIIAAAFPAFTPEQINGMIDSLEVKEAEPKNDNPPII